MPDKVIMLILSVGLYISLAFLVSLRVFRELSLRKLIISFFIVTVTTNILIAEMLHFIHAMDKPVLFLILQLIVIVIAGIILLDPLKRIFSDPLPKPDFKINRIAIPEFLIASLIALIMIGSLVVGGLSPINNLDSLHTHLPRIYYWIQHGSMATWSALTSTQLSYPINFPVQGFWLFLLGKNELLLYLVQWFALLTSIFLVYEIAGLLGASSLQAQVACLVSLSFPVILLQIFSYQGDLFIAPLVLSSVYLLVLFVKRGGIGLLYFSVLPLVLSLGAKQTSFLFLPIYLAAVLILWIKKKLFFRNILTGVLLFLLSLVLFSSFIFIQEKLEQQKTNYSMFPESGLLTRSKEKNYFKNLVTDGFRYFYQSVSIDGLTGILKIKTMDAKIDLFRGLSGIFDIDLESREVSRAGEDNYFNYSTPPPFNEDSSWFGPLSWIVIVASILLILSGKDREKKAYLGFAILYIVLYILSMAVTIQGWSPNNGRYFITPILVMMPLVSVIVPKRRLPAAIITTVIALVSIYLSISTLTMNENRPIITQKTLYSYQFNVLEKLDTTVKTKDIYKKVANKIIEDLALTCSARNDLLTGSYYDNLFYQNTPEIADINFINEHLQPSTPLYLHIRKATLEYALFGINRTRELYPVNSLDQVPSDSYVLISRSLLPDDRTDLLLVAENDHYSIFIQQ